MLYCDDCRLAFEGSSRCPSCGNEDVRTPLPEDFCFLIEINAMFADILKSVLDGNDIPSLASSTIGAGLRVRGGAMFDRIRFYVRYDDLQEAKEIAYTMFGADAHAE